MQLGRDGALRAESKRLSQPYIFLVRTVMKSRDRILIQPLGFDSPIAIAAAELERYLPKLAPVRASALPCRSSLPEGSTAHIVLCDSVHAEKLPRLGAIPQPSQWDDALAIVPRGNVTYLVGANARSVLFAAYRLLEEMGAVFLRPGPGGEVLPRRGRLMLPKKPIREHASYRHRGICIEGHPRLQHVLDLLDWMAKNKMNAFQLQFLHSGVFWRRGYTGSEMVATSGHHELTEADCLALDDRVIARVKELGMMLHRVGHGWTAAALGLDGTSWERTDEKPPKRKRGWVAQVGGKRDLWHKMPANTELCYSQPEVREAFVEGVVSYARQHSEVDALHVWMSDSYNNKCECAACRKRSPSDWYAMLVEEIARRMKQEKLPTRIVFLAYVDLLWPPEKTSITSDNVILMYAPITRCFRHPLDDPKCDAGEDAARPRLNQCRLPTTNRAHAELMRAWQKLNPPDTFLFDYHNIWVVWLDGLGQDVGAVMAQDMKDLAELGLNGFMSCQAIRAFYPTPYLAKAMADMLWNRRQSQARHRQSVMAAAFGKHAPRVEEYLSHLVRNVRVGSSYEHHALTDDGSGNRDALLELAAFAAKHRDRFAAQAKREKDAVAKTSLELIALHADHVHRIARARVAGLDRDEDAISEMRADYEAQLPAMLDRYSSWVDPLLAQTVRTSLVQAEREAE
jgi:hypothetical protein